MPSKQESSTNLIIVFREEDSRIILRQVAPPGQPEREPLFVRYLVEGESPDEALRQAADVAHSVLLRRWQLQIKGEVRL